MDKLSLSLARFANPSKLFKVLLSRMVRFSPILSNPDKPLRLTNKGLNRKKTSPSTLEMFSMPSISGKDGLSKSTKSPPI